MKPAPFEYLAPTSLPEALDAMQQHGFDAKLLAGGQSLIPVLNFRLAQPAVIVDLNGVGELTSLPVKEVNALRIGAMVRHRQIENSEAVRAFSPLLHEVMPFIAHPQIRNRGTIGGSLAHADPAAELPVIMVALQAKFKLQQQGRERWVNAVDFYQALFTTELQAEEVLSEIVIPPTPDRTGCAFSELARRHGDYAQAGVAVLITLDADGVCREARLVYLNVGEIPMLASKAAAILIGMQPTPELISEAAQIASQHEIDPSSDVHATAEYKRHLAFVLGKRTIQQAVERAKDKIYI